MQQQTLGEHIAWYLDYLAARPASRATIANYRSELGRLERFVASRGCTTAEDVTADLVRAAAADLMAEGRRDLERGRPTRSKGNEASANLLVCATRGLFVALHKARGIAGLADLNSVALPRIPQRLQPRVHVEDFVLLDEALQARSVTARDSRFLLARDAALVLFLFETGLRASEASRLNLSDVDLETGELRIHESKTRKGRRLGVLDPDDEIGDGGEPVRRLRAYLLERQRRDGAEQRRALWLGVRGQRLSPDSMRAMLRKLCEQAGTINLPVHAFRRGWFTAAYRAAPKDLPILAARMGWSDNNTRMVAVYTRGALMDFAAQPRPLVSRACFLRDARGS